MKRTFALLAFACLLTGGHVPSTASATKSASGTSDPGNQVIISNNGGTVIIDAHLGPLVMGNKHVGTVQRSLATFHHIEIAGAFTVTIVPGDKPSIKLTAETNLLPLLVSEVRDDTLFLYTKQTYRAHSPLSAFIVAPGLSTLNLSGASTVQAVGIKEDSLRVELSGSGKTTLKGAVNQLTLKLSGSGKVQAIDLTAQSVTVNISGSAVADVNAVKTLDASISGSGKITYVGNPTVQQTVSGSGSVTKQ